MDGRAHEVWVPFSSAGHMCRRLPLVICVLSTVARQFLSTAPLRSTHPLTSSPVASPFAKHWNHDAVAEWHQTACCHMLGTNLHQCQQDRHPESVPTQRTVAFARPDQMLVYAAHSTTDRAHPSDGNSRTRQVSGGGDADAAVAGSTATDPPRAARRLAPRPPAL